jgi:hypothetical protein
MCTFGTGYPAVSREGENPTNALKNCAKTAAKINLRQASELDEFQHIRSGYLEFYTNRAQPPYTCVQRLRRTGLPHTPTKGLRAQVDIHAISIPRFL